MREKKEINIQIGERVKVARERAKLTQEQMAERIEVSTQYVSDLERGVVGISISTLKRLCVALGISSDMILFGETNNASLLSLSEKCRSLNEEQTVLLSCIVNNYIKAVEIERTNNTRSV